MELRAIASGSGNDTLAHVRQRRVGRRPDTPSYAESEWVEIVRRQRARDGTGALKLPPNYTTGSVSPSSDATIAGQTYPPLAPKDPPRLANEWEFSGWGDVSYVELSAEEIEAARVDREEEKKRDGHETLGPWLASGVAGVAVAGSPLYAFPALVTVAGVYSPISLFVATLLLAFWRPIMSDLAAALPISGANYAYLLNASTSVPLALFGAALTLLDDISTSVVAAATASVYISDQAHGIVGAGWMTIVLLLVVTAIGLIGVRGSASVTLVTIAFHLTTLAVLLLCSVVHWARQGNDILRANWQLGQLSSRTEIAKAIYLGVCIAFLGVTGFETAPDYASALRPSPRIYPIVLRSLQAIAIVINAPLLLCTFAVLPLDRILSVSSVLSDLGQSSGGTWLATWVTVDAVVILLATILSGLVAALELVQRVSRDGFLPQWLSKPLPVTGVPAFTILLFATLSVLVYVTSSLSLSVVSSLFAIVFLTIMSLYPISLLVLLFNRPTLLGASRRSPFLLIVCTLILSFVLIAGVVVTDPISIAYFAAYGAALSILAWTAASWGSGMRWAWWIAEHGLNWPSAARWCVRMIKYARTGRDIVIFVKGDEINKLFRRILYVEKNEETSRIKLVHFYGGAVAPHVGVSDAKAGVPSELEANVMLLDEAFPSITVDLMLVRAPFCPASIFALGYQLGVGSGRMMMGAPAPTEDGGQFGLREFGGVRVVSD